MRNMHTLFEWLDYFFVLLFASGKNINIISLLTYLYTRHT